MSPSDKPLALYTIFYLQVLWVKRMKRVTAATIMIYGTGAPLIGATPPVVQIVLKTLCSYAFGAGTLIAMIMGMRRGRWLRAGVLRMFGSVTIVKTNNLLLQL